MRIGFAICWSYLAVAALCCVAAEVALGQAPRVVNETQARSAGIRKLSGRHLTLYTDLPSSPEVDRLPAVFDAAVPEWAAYFGVPEAKTFDWKVQGFLIGERRRFDALGLMPAGNDGFVNGISLGSELWLHDQPTDYYRRHLLLHEGTHVFMAGFLGSCGPGWYMEGMAELLATHRYDADSGRVTLGIMPRNREEVPMLGRIKLIEDAVEIGRAMSFPAVMHLDNRQQLDNESYAWCWAAAKFLDSHPRYRERFRKLKQYVLEPNFNTRVRRQFGDWRRLNAEWNAFVASLDHGYDFEKLAIDFERGQPLGDGRREVTIAADRGWQSSGLLLAAGRTYRIGARGRYQIAVEEEGGQRRAWPCEPGGVTIEYHDGEPLGILLGAMEPALDRPFVIGLGAEVKPEVSGTLYLRVNDSAGRLEDNSGSVMVTVEEVETR